MDRHRYDGGGFTLLEMMLVMVVLSVLSLLFLRYTAPPSIPDTVVIYYQLQAMDELRRVQVSERLWFNHNGNINAGQRHTIDDRSCVFTLGFGRYRCE